MKTKQIERAKKIGQKTSTATGEIVNAIFIYDVNTMQHISCRLQTDRYNAFSSGPVFIYSPALSIFF